MLVEMVLSPQEALKLSSLCIKLQPLLVYRQCYTVGVDACLFKPVPERIDSVLRRSKDINDFFGRVVLPVSWRTVMRPSEVTNIRQNSFVRFGKLKQVYMLLRNIQLLTLP
jgi:hypothetical protein